MRGLLGADLPRGQVPVSDVLEFKPKQPERVWSCQCGSQHFYLHDDGRIECRSCKLINEHIEWVFRDGQGPKGTKP